jgi:hypothetical protein
MVASSVGSNEPVVNDCAASGKRELVSCYAPNRVVVRVSGDQNVTAPEQNNLASCLPAMGGHFFSSYPSSNLFRDKK